MRDHGKRNVLGVLVDAVDYEAAVERIVTAAEDGRPYGVSALAVHGVMTGVDDDEHRHRLNSLELVTPDGQPVAWALNLLHGAKLPGKVSGPTLTLRLCQAAAERGIPVFFYGSTLEVLTPLIANLEGRFPGLKVAGSEASKFRQTTAEEKREIIERIQASGARITFVGLGCPRQEVFAYEYREALSMPVLAVGAAFDYHAGLLAEPAEWIQRCGLQWAHRLAGDPKRLWKRYLILNPRYLARLGYQMLRRNPRTRPAVAPEAEKLYG